MLFGIKQKLFGNGWLFGERDSKSVAKSRLHFVLVQDRTGLTPEEMARFKRELVEVIERYFQINEGGFDIQYKRDPDVTTLLINSPVVVRRKVSSSKASAAKSNDNNKDGAQAGVA